MRPHGFALAVALVAAPAGLQAHGTCDGISDDMARLTCFDTAHAPEIEETSAEVEAEPAPARVVWSIDREVDSLTDRTDVYLSVTSEESFQCGYDTRRATLYLRCMDNTTAALLVTSCFMADIQGYGRVRYRVDDNPAQTRTFSERTDNMALGLWSFGRSTPFIRDLEGGERLEMEFTPFNDIPKRVSFDIDGLTEALVPLRDACGW